MSKTQIAFLALAVLAVASIAVAMPTVFAAEVNPAHDADNGNGNEKSFGTCKQEANNDQACIAKK